MRRLTARRGQATVETNVLIGMAVAALVGMTIYFQRAYQGYLYANSSSHGQQFDPRENYTVDQTHAIDQFQDIDVTSGYATIGQGRGDVDLNGQTGTPPQRMLGIKVKATTTWNIDRTAKLKAKP